MIPLFRNIDFVKNTKLLFLWPQNCFQIFAHSTINILVSSEMGFFSIFGGDVGLNLLPKPTVCRFFFTLSSYAYFGGHFKKFVSGLNDFFF